MASLRIAEWGAAVTRILAKLTLVVFLSALASPCGLVPPHRESAGHAGVTASSHAHPGPDRETNGHAASPGPAAGFELCGTDISASAPRIETAVAAPSHKGGPVIVLAAAVIAHETAAGPGESARMRASPPGLDRDIFALTQRLRL
ncbi:MAG TPA: hypothetical protein VI732_01730 [Alphaproteobacteria bacterium]|nr:hypothetical protein [Alphaproteobacteria bacterium]